MKTLATILTTLLLTISIGFAADCDYDKGDPLGSLKDCAPSTGILAGEDPDLLVDDADSDFTEIVGDIIRQIQILASVVAIGVIVLSGLILVLPLKEDTKSNAKKGFIYATVGFFVAIIATILVNAVVNTVYDIFN